jgi:hypothetical protein
VDGLVVSGDMVRGVLRSPIHNILLTVPQLSISHKALETLPEDGNVMPKHVEAIIHKSDIKGLICGQGNNYVYLIILLRLVIKVIFLPDIPNFYKNIASVLKILIFIWSSSFWEQGFEE